MLDKFKESLPESLRKKLGLAETEEEESEEHSEEESEESHDPSTNDLSPEEKKKKQISMIIRVIVVIALGYMALTEFVFKSEPDNTAPAVASKPRKPRKKPQVDQNKPEEKTADKAPAKNEAVEANQGANTVGNNTAAEGSKNETSGPIPEVKPEDTKVAETPPPVENINIAEKPGGEKTTAENTSAPAAGNVTEKAPEQAIDESPKVPTKPIDTTPQVGEVKSETPSNEGKVDKSLDSLIESMDKGDGKTADTPKKTNLEEKIVVEEAYTPPPAYDQLGRGLVYNCKDKYWACLDRTAYIACNKNMKWNKAHGKPMECAVQSVYTSDEDCNTVQKYNISMSKPTTFCQ